MIKKILIGVIFIKIVIFTVIFLAYYLLPFNAAGYYANFVYPANEKVSLASAYKTWDGQHYLFLAEKGYNKGQLSNAFMPLFPILISVLTLVTRNSFLAAILLSNIASFAGIYFFYKLTDLLYGHKISKSAVIFLLAFPVSFFFSLIYTESLFFFLVISSFYFLYKRNYLLASLIAFFLPLERFVGVFIIIPFFVFYIFEDRKFTLNSQVLDIIQSLFNKKLLLFFTPLLGLLTYFIFIYLRTGNVFELFDQARFFIAQPSISYILHPLSLIKVLFFNLSLHGFNNSIIDRIFILFFLSLIYPLYKRTNFTFLIYALIMGLFFILVGNIMSYTRHLLVIFPIFIVLAIIFENKKYEFLKFPFIYLLMSLQILFLVMHALNYWVA